MYVFIYIPLKQVSQKRHILQYALQLKDYHMVQLLCDAGADVNVSILVKQYFRVNQIASVKHSLYLLQIIFHILVFFCIHIQMPHSESGLKGQVHNTSNLVARVVQNTAFWNRSQILIIQVTYPSWADHNVRKFINSLVQFR